MFKRKLIFIKNSCGFLHSQLFIDQPS